jgi:serine/threonine protein kinase
MIREQSYTASVDIWSSGVVMFLLTTGQLPFRDDDAGVMFQKIVYADPVFPGFISPLLADLLRKMLAKDPEARISLERIKEHPWFSRAEYSHLVKHLPAGRNESDSYVDASIAQQMEQLGMGSEDLKRRLFGRTRTDFPVAYTFLKREKDIEKLNAAVLKSVKGLAVSMDGFPELPIDRDGEPSTFTPGRRGSPPVWTTANRISPLV